MLQNLRQEKILEELQAHRAVKVTELARIMESSESTIRRDINELDRMGKLRKVFGGAVSLSSDMVPGITDVAERNRINTEEKERIAAYAASLIADDDFVYIDAGTTTERMIHHLESRRGVTYVTNGIIHAGKLVQKGLQVYMIGGILRPATEAVIGPSAIDAVRQYNFTKCFMGTNGIDVEKGFTTPDLSEAAVKTAVIRRSSEAFVLADHAKFGRISSVTFAGIEEARIITDRVDDTQFHRETVIDETG